MYFWHTLSKVSGNTLNFLFRVSILKVQGTWQLHVCSLPLHFVVSTQPWEAHTILPCPKRSNYIICLTSLWVPLHLGTSRRKGLLWLPACSLFNDTSLWNVVSLQGIISQGARKERGTDYQKNHCNAGILLIGKNLHHQHAKHLISFNCYICFLGSNVLVTVSAC